jgi:hypothetical protein
MIGMNISDYIRWKQHNSLTRPPTSTQTSAEPAATAAAAAAAVPAGLLPIPRSARSGANKTTRSKGFFTQLAGEGGQKVPRDCRVEEEPRKCEGQTKSAAVGPPPTVQQKQKQKQKQKKTSVATQAEDGKEREVARLKAKLDQRSVGLLMMQQQLHALEAQAKQREQELAAKDTQLAAARWVQSFLYRTCSSTRARGRYSLQWRVCGWGGGHHCRVVCWHQQEQ